VPCENQAVEQFENVQMKLLLILKISESVPKTSIRQLSQQINLSVRTTDTMLHKSLHLYPQRTGVEELKLAN
jgi:hypothetical protein